MKREKTRQTVVTKSTAQIVEYSTKHPSIFFPISFLFNSSSEQARRNTWGQWVSLSHNLILADLINPNLISRADYAHYIAQTCPHFI